MVLHPVAVHFPIAFYILECFLLGLFLAKRDEAYKRFALLSFRLAYGLALVAMALGLRDAGGFAHIKGEVLEHVISADVLFLISTSRAFYWRFGKTQNNYAAVLFWTSLAAVIAVAVTGFLGGELVYK